MLSLNINQFLRFSEDFNTTFIQVFSYSLIAGAYCDDGQNYYNIMNLIQSIDWADGFEQSGDGSCAPPPPPDDISPQDDVNDQSK